MAKSILMTEKGKCYLCGRQGITQLHHCMGGTGRRKMSDEDGLTVYLCPSCHNLVHNNRAFDLILKHDAQQAWEHCYGDREAFIERYSKSWMED